MSGVSLCPHGKTTMAPQLWRTQLEDGAWGITVATAAQLRVAEQFGVPRVLLANQLAGQANVDAVLEALRRSPQFEAIVLVDSLAGLAMLLESLQRQRIGRPLPLLLEVGAEGGRAGVRSLAEGIELGRTVAAAAPWVSLRGVECFEDVFGRDEPARVELSVLGLLDTVAELARAGCEEGWFAPGEVILSAGGSSFFDLAAQVLRTVSGAREFRVVLRSGCTLTHDSLHYQRMQERMRGRGHGPWPTGPGLRAALEVWAAVQSLPEPGRALCGLGKRDASFDLDLPLPLWWFRPGRHTSPQPAPEALAVTRLNDQHAFVDGAGAAALAVGDLLGFGISHPCTTFDKWPLVLEVDDDYTVLGGIRTYF